MCLYRDLLFHSTIATICFFSFQVLTNKMSKKKSSKFPLKTLSFLLIVTVGSLVYYDIRQHGSWERKYNLNIYYELFTLKCKRFNCLYTYKYVTLIENDRNFFLMFSFCTVGKVAFQRLIIRRKMVI